MLFNNFTNNKQTRRPSEIINSDELYQQVINEQPDEENLQQDVNSSNNVERQPKKNRTKSSNKHSLKLHQENQQKIFSSLTQSQKALEIQKIYQQSQINSIMFQIHEIIEQQKLNINVFVQNKPQRKSELQIYNQKLQSLTDMLKQSMGTTKEIKIYLSKKVLMILKNIGRFKQFDEYNSLINRINKIAGIKEQQKCNNNQITQTQKNNFVLQQHKQPNQNNTSNMIKNQIRRKKKAMTLSLRLQNKPNVEENQQPVTFWHRVNQPLNEDDQNFQQILQRVDSIHQNHLKTWFKHNNEIKQLQQKRKLIKSRYSSLHTKKSNGNSRGTSQVQYRRVNKFFSLIHGRQNSQCEEEKQLKQCFETLQNEVSKRMSSSLPALNQNVKRNSLKKQHQVKLKINLDSEKKAPKAPLKLRRTQKRQSTIKSTQKRRKSKQSPKNRNKNSKDSDQILQTKKITRSSSRKKSILRSSTEVSIKKSENKNNSVHKSSIFRNLSLLPNNQKKISKEKQSRHLKLAPIKNMNKQKQHKLKIV